MRISFTTARQTLAVIAVIGLGTWMFTPDTGAQVTAPPITVRTQGTLDPKLQTFADRILEQTTHNPVAFGIGPEMLNKLPPEDSLAIAKAVWPAVAHQHVKTAILKTFAFGRHPKVLQVLHLGMTSSDPKVVQYAESYLKSIAMRSFGADRSAYQLWYNKHGEQTLEQVFTVAYQRLADDLRGVDASIAIKVLDELNVDFGGSRRKTSYPEARMAVAKTDLADTVVGWFENETLDDRSLRDASQLLARLPVDMSLAETKILPLTAKGTNPIVRSAAAEAIAATHPDAARQTLLDLLSSTVADAPKSEQELLRTDVCFKLSMLGDPQTIAPMIAIMDSDNSKEVCRDIGAALCQLKLGEITRAKQLSFADGRWWRNWWKLNKQRLPKTARQMVVEDLPKTAHGKTYQPRDLDLDTHEGRVKVFREEFAKLGRGPGGHDLWSAASVFAEAGDPRAIPFLIGAIEADNSYDTVYGVGYFALGHMNLGKVTGVKYSSYHDGAWWRRWWNQNKSRFSDEVQAIPITEFPKTTHGSDYTPFPVDLDTHAGRVQYLTEQLAKPDAELSELAELFDYAADPRGIPVLIGVISSYPNQKAIYDIGYFGLSHGSLGRMTKVSYDATHDGVWWQAWWATHRKDFPAAADIPIPKFEIAGPDPLADVADVPAENIRINDDANKRYFLIGDPTAAAPKAGYKLLIVMPGGDGGADFHPFIRRIYKHVLDDSWLVAQPVSVWWNKDQQIVWPKGQDKIKDLQFTTEEFVEMVVVDVKSRANIDPKNVITLTWSSSGPAAYAIAFQPTKSITASYIAMSVFRPQWYGSMESANGMKFLLDHSPDDAVCPYEHADLAEETLKKLGAEVNRIDYNGGHGWRGDVFGRLQKGLDWLVN